MTSKVRKEVGSVCQGCGKISYSKRRGAMRKLKLLERKGTKRSYKAYDGPVDVYQCPYGTGWHVGHRRDAVPVAFDIARVGRRSDADET